MIICSRLLFSETPLCMALTVLCLLLLAPTGLRGQAGPDDTAARFKVLEERIRALEVEIQTLKAAQAAALPPAFAAPGAVPPAVAQAPVAAGGPSLQLPVYGGASAMSKVLNPDIGVIGDFLGAVGRNSVRSAPVLEMHESEASFQAIVDPYARADFFVSFGEEGVSLEEGYLTFTALPGGLVAKVGKMRANFGKVNTLHNHNLPWTDRPLVTENIVGGEEGLTDAGLSVSRILAGPKNLFLEATGQVFRGDSAGVFESHQRKDASVVGHLRGYRDLSESTNLDLGISYARGHNGFGSAFITQLYGLDATLRWRPLRRAIYHSFMARGEFIWGRSDQITGKQRPFGFYTSADYRLNRRWTVGGRYDWAERMRHAGQTDSGFSALLTYWPSEFSQIRGQYRFTRYAQGSTDLLGDPVARNANELRFQFLFSLGAHGAHPF